MTRSNDSSRNAGRKRFCCTNAAFLMSHRSRNPLASRNEFRQRSVPKTARFHRIPRKLLSCPVPQPHSSTFAPPGICSSKSLAKMPCTRFLGQALFGIKIVVVGEGVFFVEYFHHIRNVVRLIHGIMRVEEKRNTIVGLVDRATIPAGQCLIPGNQRAATVWTAQNIEVLCQEFLHRKSHVRRLRSILDPRKSSQGATARSLSCFDRLALAPAT